MRLTQVGLVALAFLTGCVRFGYDDLRVSTDPAPDASHNGGGTGHGFDAAVADAASPQQDAANLDASMPAASTPDAANQAAGAGASGAAAPHDTGVPDDDAGQTSMDAGAMDGGPMDGGLIDGGSSATGPCAVTVTENSYRGTPNFHGTLVLQNTGTTTWTTPTIHFDLRSSANVCNDADVLPGTGWILQTNGMHCAYTKTSTSLSIAPGATLKFEYSTDDSRASSASAVANVSVTGCP